MVLPWAASGSVAGTARCVFGLAGSPPGPSAGAVAALAAATLAAIHVFAGRVRLLSVVPRSRVLSFAGGASVAYVFVHVLPELERAARSVDRWPTRLPAHEESIYLLTLLGFIAYYGLEQVARRSGPPGEDAAGTTGLFWVHLGSFVVYNGLIGYLLFHRETPGVGNFLLFSAAMGFHLLVNDVGLRDHYADEYHRIGRWLLAAAVLAGGVTGAVTALDPSLLGAAFALLAGAIILNTVKEELPRERESRFSAFAIGAVGYAALLLAV